MHVACTDRGGELELLHQPFCLSYGHVFLRERNLEVDLCISVVLSEVLEKGHFSLSETKVETKSQQMRLPGNSGTISKDEAKLWTREHISVINFFGTAEFEVD